MRLQAEFHIKYLNSLHAYNQDKIYIWNKNSNNMSSVA